MLIDSAIAPLPGVLTAQVAIVGAGPAGIVCALELARRNVSVVLVESGDWRCSADAQALSECVQFDPKRHAPMHECTRRQVGGASVIWGGRCVPLDPIDFETRAYVQDSAWPVGYADIQPYFAKAAEYCLCGRSEFTSHAIAELPEKTIVPGFPEGDVRASELERWSLPTNFGKEYRRELLASRRISLVCGVSCVEIVTTSDGSQVQSLRGRTRGGAEIRLEASQYVIACGGLETTRLLLASDGVVAGGLGNKGGALGRYYMGHISGSIARARFWGSPRDTAYGFWRDREGVYVRPRFTLSAEAQRRESLTNIAAWLVNPTVGDPRHRNGVLSFAYLALSSRFGHFLASEAIRKAAIGSTPERCLLAHLKNVVCDLPRTLKFIPTFGAKRYLAWRKVPGFYQMSGDNCYHLHYHGEQVPNRESRITLSEFCDHVGLRRLNIDLRFCDQDVDSVIRTHDVIDRHLQDHGVGCLDYVAGDLRANVWDQARDGFHQMGTTRMSESPHDGVVDRNCTVHGVENLHVASSSVFRTSGQANSTFTIVAFTLRLVERLASIGLRSKPVEVASSSG